MLKGLYTQLEDNTHICQESCSQDPAAFTVQSIFRCIFETALMNGEIAKTWDGGGLVLLKRGTRLCSSTMYPFLTV